MGNRSKFVTGAAAVTGMLGVRRVRGARRRARLNAAADGIQESILPTHVPPSTEPLPSADVAHAPGHTHLAPAAAADAHAADRAVHRPWTKRYHGLRHPGRL
jgi:hypothetical protein